MESNACGQGGGCRHGPRGTAFVHLVHSIKRRSNKEPGACTHEYGWMNQQQSCVTGHDDDGGGVLKEIPQVSRSLELPSPIANFIQRQRVCFNDMVLPKRSDAVYGKFIRHGDLVREVRE